MKKIFAFLLLFIAIKSYAQYPVKQRLGGDSTEVFGTTFRAQKGFINGAYVDTASANLSRISQYPYAQIAVGDTMWYRNSTATAWIKFGSGSGTGGPTTIYVKPGLTVDTTTNPGFQTLGLAHADGLVSGGIVTGAGGMDIDVTSALISLNYRYYVSPSTTLTIPAADATFHTKYTIIADTNGVISYLAGAPAANAIEPQPNPSSQIKLTVIDVAPLATSLDINTIVIYDEHTGSPEWTVSMAGTITHDPDNTDNPFNLTIADFISAYGTGSQLIFTKPSGTDTVFNNSVFKMFLYFNGPFTNQIQMQLYHGATAVSNNIVINGYFASLDSNVYQNCSVPRYAFNLTSNIVDKIVFTFSGNDLSGARGLYLDYFQLQTGVTNTTTGDFVDSLKRVGDSLYYYKHGTPVFAGAFTNGTVSNVTGTTPINVATGTTTPVITIDNSAADGSTKGAASFTANDFNATTGNISLDYINGQAVDATHKGFVPAGGSAAKILHGDGTWKDTTASGSTPDLQTVTTVGNTTTLGINALRFNANTTAWAIDTLIFYGDSKTAGTGLPVYQFSYVYPSLVSANFSKFGWNKGAASSTIYDTTAGNNLFTQMATSIPNKRPGISGLFFYYFHNDAGAGASAAYFISTYRRIMDTCILHRGYLASELHVLMGNTSGSNQTLVSGYHDSLAIMCAQKGIQFLDFYALETNCINTGNTIFVDGVHENIYGQNLIATFINSRLTNYTLKDSASYAAVVANGTIDATKLRFRKGDSTGTINTPDLPSSSIVGVNKYGSLFPFNSTAFVPNVSLDSTRSPNNINITGDLRAGLLSATDNIFNSKRYATAVPGIYLSFSNTSLGGFIDAENGLQSTYYPLHLQHGGNPTILGDANLASNGDVLQVAGKTSIIGHVAIGSAAVSSTFSVLNLPATHQEPTQAYTGLLINQPTSVITNGTLASVATVPFVSLNTFNGDTLRAVNDTTGLTYTKAATVLIISKPIGAHGVTIQNPYSLYDSIGRAYFGDTLQIKDGTQGAGKVFTSDADGNGSWQTPGGGGGGGTVTSVSGTTNRITSTGGATPVIDISASYVGQSSITTLGTVTTGTLSTGAVIGGVTTTLGSDAQGDIYYRNGSGVLTRLAAGTANQVLHSGTTPSWKDTTAAGAGGGSGITRNVSSTSTSAAAGATALTDYVIYASGATTTITLPTAVSNTNRYTIMRTGTSNVDIATTSSQTINGAAAPLTLTVQYASVDIISDGSNWFIH